MHTLRNPETGETVEASRATAAALREKGYEDVTAVGADAESSGIEQPAKSAKRDEWDEYARLQGLDPEEYSTKDDLIEAAEAAA